MKAPTTPDKNQGEGNIEAARRYDDAARQFVKSGRVAPAASSARPGTAAEEAELRRAEQAGLAHSKGEDPIDPAPPIEEPAEDPEVREPPAPDAGAKRAKDATATDRAKRQR